MKKFFAIDLMPLLYRGYFAFLKKPALTASGINTSALIGFANSLMSILSEHKPDYIAVAADPAGKTFRHEMYPEYKAGRAKMPEDIGASIPRAIELAEALNIPIVRAEGFEADDVMGTLARLGAEAGLDVFVATPDKDAAQLVATNIRLYRPGKGGDAAEIYDAAKVCEHWQISSPRQMIEYLALAGDASDNIPGIRGVGEKTAVGLLAKYPDAEAIIAHANEIPGKLGEKVRGGIDDLRLSRKLVTIRDDVPVEFDLERFARREADKTKLAAFCKKYELNRLAAYFGIDTAAAASSTVPFASLPHEYTLVESDEDAAALVEELSRARKIAFDTETTGTDSKNDELVGISFCTEEGKACYVPARRKSATAGSGDLFGSNAADADAVRGVDPAVFAGIFGDPAKTLIAHNAKFDIAVLERYGIKFGGTVHDTMLAHYVLDAAARHNKEFLAKELLNVDAIPISSLIGSDKAAVTMGDLPPEAICEYAAQDADLAFRWDAILRKKVAEAGALAALEDGEEPLVPILLEMEKTGVKFDLAALARLGAELSAETMAILEDIRAIAGTGLNPDSPKQLGEFLFGELGLGGGRKTSSGQYSTDEKTLLKLVDAHPVVKKILDYRALVKLKNTYVDKLPRLADASGRIHTTFTQAFTETGRLSSANPNLQNIPVRRERGKALRAAVVPEDDNSVIVSADYSQIELRIMAAMSGDANMIRAFREGADIHRDTAARVYGIMPELVTDDMRSKCKMVNFGIIYGISSFGLAERLGCSRKEAANLIETYFKTYPKIKAFMEALVAKARTNGYAETLLGRRRTLENINSRNAPARQAAERDAINTPVQGTAADLIKTAMVRVHRALAAGGFKTRMILQIHDELLFETPKAELDAVTPVIKREMENAMSIGVPLEVAIGSGANWLEAH